MHFFSSLVSSSGSCPDGPERIFWPLCLCSPAPGQQEEIRDKSPSENLESSVQWNFQIHSESLFVFFFSKVTFCRFPTVKWWGKHWFLPSSTLTGSQKMTRLARWAKSTFSTTFLLFISRWNPTNYLLFATTTGGSRLFVLDCGIVC